MDPSTAYREIALLNHQGALALACGNDREAHRTFKAIVEAFQILSGAGGAATNTTGNEDGPLNVCVYSTISVPDLQDEQFFIFGEVLLYNTVHVDSGGGNNNTTTPLPSLLDLGVCSCYALFNMALTYHRRAKVTGTRQYYLVASRVYEQCLRLADSFAVHIEDINRLRVVILNNLAQIYYFEMHLYDEALQRMEHVKTLVMVDDGNNSSMNGFEAPFRDQIFLNLLLTEPPFAAGCA